MYLKKTSEWTARRIINIQSAAKRNLFRISQSSSKGTEIKQKKKNTKTAPSFLIPSNHFTCIDDDEEEESETETNGNGN